MAVIPRFFSSVAAELPDGTLLNISAGWTSKDNDESNQCGQAQVFFLLTIFNNPERQKQP